MKSWEQRERARDTLSKEVGYVTKPHGDRLRVALAFPEHLLGRDVEPRLPDGLPAVQRRGRHRLRARVPAAEAGAGRAARDAGTPLVTLESQTPVGDFDVIAFSVSFEWDYVNVLTLLRLAGIPRYAAERTDAPSARSSIGGAVTFVNPEPLAPFADVIAAGEGEVLVPVAAPRVQRRDRSRRPAAPARRASAASTCRRSTSRSYARRRDDRRLRADAPAPARRCRCGRPR